MAGPRPVVMSGPSGAGKSTLLKKLLKEFDGVFGFSVSRKSQTEVQKLNSSSLVETKKFQITKNDLWPDTTRSPRPGEENGKG